MINKNINKIPVSDGEFVRRALATAKLTLKFLVDQTKSSGLCKSVLTFFFFFLKKICSIGKMRGGRKSSWPSGGRTTYVEPED